MLDRSAARPTQVMIDDARVWGIAFGAVVRKLRETAGLTQDALAQATGISQSGISRIEHGQPPIVTDEWQLCTALRTPVASLHSYTESTVSHALQAAKIVTGRIKPWKTVEEEQLRHLVAFVVGMANF